jgi:uncharacterized protein (DUF305 family)
MNLLSKKRATCGAVILSAVAVISLSGCGNDKEDASADHNKQDVSFAQNMIPHHGQAVEMSQMATTRAQNERVKTLAKQIEAAQQPEIDTMNGWLTKWGEETVNPSASADEHAGHGSSMPGMMSADDMKKMEAASGAAFDRMYLEMMIEHHKGAIEMAKTETEKGKSTDAKALAASITSSQQTEITEMEGLLKTL